MSAIIIRRGHEGDHGYVLKTWKHSFLEKCRAARPHTQVQSLMRRVLSRADLHVACAADSESTLSGWVLAESGDIWWLYVALDMRGPPKRGAKVSEMLREAAGRRTS